MVKDGRLKVKRVRGDENPADHLMKPKNFVEMAPMVRAAGGLLVGAGLAREGSGSWESLRTRGMDAGDEGV